MQIKYDLFKCQISFSLLILSILLIFISDINIIMQPNEQQGFSNDSPTEIIEVSYIPLVSFKKYQSKIYSHPLKLISEIKIIPNEKLINKPLEQQLRQNFIKKHQDNIIYSCKQKQKSGNYGQIQFDSNFQNGNLQYVIKNGDNYDLYIKPDTNTKTHFQWFYFKMRNKIPITTCIVIKNFMKSSMLYKNGLKPYFRSRAKLMKNYEQLKNEVSFDKNEDQESYFYELSFDFNFQYSNDEVQICSQPPYSYGRFNKLLKSLSTKTINISKTMMEHKIQAFVINQNINSKAVIVAIARQHPGQSVGSWMMQGFLKKLFQTNNQATWIIIPMINIDGVAMGNNRTGLLGFDFNRHWYIDQDTNRQYLFPEIMGIIKYFKNKKKDYQKKIKIFLDFHGHSSKQNVFAYGPPHHKSSQYYDLSRLFPYLISNKNRDFNFSQCSYQIQSQKRGCSRSMFFNKMGFPYSYTIQSSFGIYQNRCVNEKDMIKMGSDIFQTTLQFIQLLTSPKQKEHCTQYILRELIENMKKELVQNFNHEHYDSDSDNQDENSPIRTQFYHKLTELLVNSQDGDALYGKDDKSRRNISELDRRQKLNSPPLFIKHPFKKTKVDREHLKTEQVIDLSKGNNIREKSVILPKISFNRQARREWKYHSKDQKNLDSMTLQQVKERLISLKHSKLGKRILIMQ